MLISTLCRPQPREIDIVCPATKISGAPTNVVQFFRWIVRTAPNPARRPATSLLTRTTLIAWNQYQYGLKPSLMALAETNYEIRRSR